MATVTPLKHRSVQDEVAPGEWRARVDLAAVYRLIAHFGWDDLINTHCSARVPGPDRHFLLNPFGLMFDEITASSLVKIDVDGNKVADSPYEVIPAGFTIHSAIHMAREDAHCVIHTHTIPGMAVSAQADGLLPLTQKALAFHGRLGYHDYEGIADDLDERQRLAGSLGPHRALILRNHGLMTCGRTMAEAFVIMRRLEHACQAQIAAQSGGAALVTPSAETCEHTARQFEASNEPAGVREWPALLRMLDRIDPSYAH